MNQRMKMVGWGARACCWLLLGSCCLAGSGCNRHGASAPGAGSEVRPVRTLLQRNVELARVQQRSLVYRVEMVGTLEAEGETNIAAGVNGVVDEVLFREGDEVSPGTILVKVDQDLYESDAALARATLQRAGANLELARDLYERAERAGRGLSEEERVKSRGNLRIAEAELRSTQASLARALRNLERSRVRAPYAGRINKRLITRGSFLEDKTPIASMADLSHIRLNGYVPETAAPILRRLLGEQDKRLAAHRLTLPLGGFLVDPFLGLLGIHLVDKDFVLSGFDPEFELLAMPGPTFYARIFFMSTVANPDTHMFEAKAEVLGWQPDMPPPLVHYLKSLPAEKARSLKLGLALGGWFCDPYPWPGLLGQATLTFSEKRQAPTLMPGFTAKIRFPLRSTPQALMVPEEAVRASERGFLAFVPQQQPDDNKEWVARARSLELGFRTDGWVEVRQGLNRGELIVRRGAEALEDGTPIRFEGFPP